MPEESKLLTSASISFNSTVTSGKFSGNLRTMLVPHEQWRRSKSYRQLGLLHSGPLFARNRGHFKLLEAALGFDQEH
jgi:hypothetical protein